MTRYCICYYCGNFRQEKRTKKQCFEALEVEGEPGMSDSYFKVMNVCCSTTIVINTQVCSIRHQPKATSCGQGGSPPYVRSRWVRYMVSLANKTSRSRWLTMRGSLWLFLLFSPQRTWQHLLLTHFVSFC